MIKIYVMATCPDCVEVKRAAEGDPLFSLVDIGAQARSLKEFLRLRDAHPKFATARRLGLIGIPSFLLEDGSITFNPSEVGLNLNSASATSAAAEGPSVVVPETLGPACKLDGSGC